MSNKEEIERIEQLKADLRSRNPARLSKYGNIHTKYCNILGIYEKNKAGYLDMYGKKEGCGRLYFSILATMADFIDYALSHMDNKELG